MIFRWYSGFKQLCSTGAAMARGSAAGAAHPTASVRAPACLGGAACQRRVAVGTGRGVWTWLLQINELMQGRRCDQTTHCRSTRIGPRIFAGRGPVQGLVQGGVGGEHGAVMRVRSGNSTGVLAPAVRGRRASLNICLRRAHQFADGICTPDTCHGAV